MDINSFTETQIRDLEKSGLTPDDAMKVGWFCIRNERDAERILKRTPGFTGPGLAIPYYPNGDTQSPAAAYRVRPDNPRTDKNGKNVKYEQPSSTELSLYIPPTLDKERLFNSMDPIVITEGEKKAVCGVKFGLLSIAGSGVFGFHKPEIWKKEKRLVLKDDFNAIRLRDRKVYIVFDALKFDKPSVLLAENWLAQMLEEAGSKVLLVHLPKRSGKDVGLDDFLTAKVGGWGQAGFMRLMEEAWSFPVQDHIGSIHGKELSSSKNKFLVEAGTAYLSLLPPEDAHLYVKHLKTITGLPIDQLRLRVSQKRSEAKTSAPDLLPETPLAELLEKLRRSDAEDRKELAHYMKGKRKLLVLSSLIIEDMKKHGRFINDGQRLWYFKNDSCEIESVQLSQDLRIHLKKTYGVNASENEYRFLMYEIEGEGYANGTKAKVHKFSYFDRPKHTLYLYNSATEVFKATRRGVETIKNGDDGIYFEPVPAFEKFQYIAKPRLFPLAGIINALKLKQGPEHFTAKQVETLISLFLTYMLFERRLRPIIHFQGTQGSGKSVIARIVGRTQMGPSFDVSSDITKKDDLIAALCSTYLLGWDNIEEMSGELINVLCTATTGGKDRRRKLYSDNDMVEYDLECAVITTSRNNVFQIGRPDLTDRMIILCLDQRQYKGSEEKLYQAVAEARNHFWSSLVNHLPLYLQRLQDSGQYEFETIVRMSEFWTFALRITNRDPQVADMMCKTRLMQAMTSLDSLVWDCLGIFIKEAGRIDGKTSSELLQKLVPIANEQFNSDLNFSAKSFTMFLQEQSANLNIRWRYESKVVSGVTHHWFSERTNDNGVNDAPIYRMNIREASGELRQIDFPPTPSQVGLWWDGDYGDFLAKSEGKIKNVVDNGNYGDFLEKYKGKNKNYGENNFYLNKGFFHPTTPLSPCSGGKWMHEIVIAPVPNELDPGEDARLDAVAFILWRAGIRLEESTDSEYQQAEDYYWNRVPAEQWWVEVPEVTEAENFQLN